VNTITEYIDIEYRNRKSLEIQITREGRVRVLAPKGATNEWINDVLNEKKDWIKSKLKDVHDRESERPTLGSGSMIWVKGVKTQLKVSTPCDVKSSNSERNIELEMNTSMKTVEGVQSRGELPVEHYDEILYIHCTKALENNELHLKQLLIDWYFQQTKKAVNLHVNNWSKSLRVSPKVVKIKEQKKRWGSASSRGNLNFNWRLSMAPDSVLEYVVVHELCHFHHMNHSKEFWNLVESVMPDYKSRREWLKKHGHEFFWLE